ncbi:MAG: hypothetical protein JNL57_08705 [Bacteroidetes bacterium]|nr:hypothetical protein [Bacteroidota bacterium]
MSAIAYWNEFKSKLSGFFQKNRKLVTIGGTVVLVVAGLFLFWSLYWQPKRETEAGSKLAKLHHYFEKDSFDVVLNGIKGRKNFATAPKIADDYSWTKKGKEAALMAGLAYMRTGKYEKAISYLDKTDAHDMILAPSIEAAKAGCYAELGKLDKAAKQYEKAAEMGNNDFTAQFYKKAGIHYELAKSYKDALRCYEKIKAHYATTPEGSDIEKYIYKAKGLAGELNN